MDIESLIWIAAVVIWAVSAILKKKRVASPPPAKNKSRKVPEWKEKLDQYLAQIRQELTTEPEEAAAVTEIHRAEKPLSAVIPDARKTRLERAARIESLERSAEDRFPETVLQKPETELEKTVRPEMVPEFVIEDLQKAIIWSEILGSPVALKHDRR